jgi:hypothetical protein
VAQYEHVGPQVLELLNLGGEQGRKLVRDCLVRHGVTHVAAVGLVTREYFACPAASLSHVVPPSCPLRRRPRCPPSQAFGAAAVISKMLGTAASASSIRRYVLQPLLAPLLAYTGGESSSPASAVQTEVVFAEAEVVACVERLHKVVCAVPVTPAVADGLASVVLSLFDLYCAAQSSTSFLVTACEVRPCFWWRRDVTDFAPGVRSAGAFRARCSTIAFFSLPHSFLTVMHAHAPLLGTCPLFRKF